MVVITIGFALMENGKKVDEVGMNDMQTLVNIAGMTAELIKSGELVRVVRCKDCKNHECKDMYGDWVCEIDGSHRSPEWYCADGIAKDINVPNN